MNILAIGAHPDDVDLLCGGTLALYAAAGHRVSVAIATNGNVGSPTLTRDEIAAIRHEEALRSCAVIGADLLWLDFDDEWLFDGRETRTAFINAYRQARPDIVIAHDTRDYHPDHRVAGQVAADARIPPAVRLVETGLPALESIPKLYTMDTVGQLVGGLATYVDITDVMDTKVAMLTSHVSQEAWLAHIFDMSYVEFMQQQCGTAAPNSALPTPRRSPRYRTIRPLDPTSPDSATSTSHPRSHLGALMALTEDTAHRGLAAAAAASLASCTSSDARSVAPKAGAQTIRFSIWFGEGDIEVWKEVIAGFQKANPDITVKFEPLEYGSFWTKLNTQLAGGSAPDVIGMQFQSGFSARRVSSRTSVRACPATSTRSQRTC